jgi:hypothetical protein
VQLKDDRLDVVGDSRLPSVEELPVALDDFVHFNAVELTTPRWPWLMTDIGGR